MAEHNLKIGVKSDLKGGSSLLNFLKDVQKTITDIAKKATGLNLGGGPAGPDGRPKPGSKDLGKQLSDSVRGLRETSREVDKLTLSFNKLGVAVRSAGWGARMPGATPPPGAANSPMGGGLPPWFQPPGGPPNAPGQPPAPGPGGVPWWQRNVPGGGFVGSMARMIGWGAVLNNVREGFFGGPTREIQWTLNQANQAASGNAAIGGMGARMLGGDIMPAVGLMRAMGGGKGGFTAFTPGDVEKVLGLSEEEQKKFAMSKGLSLNFFKGLNLAGQNFTGEARASAIHKKMAEMIEGGIAQDPLENQRIQMAMAQAPARVGFARRFGKDFNANVPLGMNVDPNQVMGTVSAVLSALGTGVNIQKLTDVATKATRAGLGSEAITAAMTLQGQGQGHVLGRVFGTGMSRGMMEQAIAGAAGLAGQSLLGVDASVLASGLNVGPGGTGLQMRQRQAGAGFLNQVTTGGLDAFQQTMNVAAASKKGRSVYTTQALSGMPMAELVSAAIRGPTAEQKAAGITKEMAKDQLNAVVNSLGNRAVSESGVETPAGLKVLMQASQGEGGIAGFIERNRGNKGLMTQLNTGLALVTNQGLGADLTGFLSGATHPGKEGQAPAGTSGRFAGAMSASLAGLRQFEQEGDKLVLVMRDLNAVTATYGKTIQGFESAMKEMDPDAALAANLSVAGLGKAMGDIAKVGPDAVNVMMTVQKFVEAIAKKKDEAEELERQMADFSQLGG